MGRVERLAANHATASFVSGNDDLDDWLRASAATADRAGTARVYLWLDEDEVLGYFAIVPHTVRREDIPSAIGRGAPATIPGFLLARLAVSERIRGQGYGAELLATALATTLAAIRLGGGRVIVVDAIDENAVGFYQYHGFTPVPDSDRLVMKASTAAASLEIERP